MGEHAPNCQQPFVFSRVWHTETKCSSYPQEPRVPPHASAVPRDPLGQFTRCHVVLKKLIQSPVAVGSHVLVETR
jgi:hypothetical protein